MGTLWQFFGFPDPEAPAQEAVKRTKKKKVKAEEAPGQQLTLVNPDDEINEPLVAEVIEEKVEPVSEPLRIPPPIRSTPVIPKGWTGPVTPDGIPFHDLSNYSSKSSGFPDRALRYVVPDKMHRLPIRQIHDRLHRGDTVIVDLNGLIHMDTQTNACRRILKQMADDIGIDIFALDESDKLLLIPGSDVTMDVGKNQLGLAPILM
ncbi:MAG: hypothetical protein DWC06_03895 [Candidatus Poseidoniales archaeon]|nr:hypothetical protein [Candidatus Poseidoniales archaeon]RJV01076.1 MAG: hypothetical protein DWC06_03895 [Candidatus Poseidoniales archaeon]|tara:strand:- start:11 stop:625 length:615 start_codon:yes stop_codon:yes gene_type:complete